MKLRITNRPDRLIAAIKVIREATGLSLVDAKGVLDLCKWFPANEKQAEELRQCGADLESEPERLRIKDGWHEAGKTGKRIGWDVIVKQSWTPVLWDDEEDPDWFKAAGLEAVG